MSTIYWHLKSAKPLLYKKGLGLLCAAAAHIPKLFWDETLANSIRRFLRHPEVNFKNVSCPIWAQICYGDHYQGEACSNEIMAVFNAQPFVPTPSISTSTHLHEWHLPHLPWLYQLTLQVKWGTANWYVHTCWMFSTGLTSMNLNRPDLQNSDNVWGAKILVVWLSDHLASSRILIVWLAGCLASTGILVIWLSDCLTTYQMSSDDVSVRQSEN